MIIVDRDKKGIINFDNIILITIECHKEYTPDKEYLISAEISSNEYIELGMYRTEERAKEVLKEIVQLFTEEEMFHINKSSLNNLDEIAEPKYILRPVSRNKVFYMPKE